MDEFDIVVIGSGFGGAVAAYELTKAGKRVCLLERGPWFDTPAAASLNVDKAPLPRGLGFFHRLLRSVHHSRWLPKGLLLNRRGLLEMFRSGDVSVVCSSGVGGGSHAYGGLHSRPLDCQYWSKASHSLSDDEMEVHYQAVLQQLGSYEAPQYSGVGEDNCSGLLQSDMPKMYWGYRQQKVNFLEEGMFGSPQGGKVSLVESYLLPAIELGLEIRALQEVTRIQRLPEGYQLNVRDLQVGRETLLQTEKVIVAAGTMNTLRLLQSSMADGGLPCISNLGRRFSVNADVMAFWPVNEKGGNQAAGGPYKQVFQERAEIPRYQILKTGISGLAAIPLPGFMRRWLQRHLFLAAMGVDNAEGRVQFNERGFVIEFDVANDGTINAIKEAMKKMAAGKSRLFLSKKLTTVHPLGGAVLSDDPTEGVVNAEGELHAAPGLYIADASVLPAALGTPPSLTVAAWARHLSHTLSRQ